MMVLGVVLHGSLIYSTRAVWIISDADRAPIFDALYRMIHSFRMPAFFMIAGFLCVPSLHKGVNAFLRDRSRRLILPLVATALLLNSLQVLLVWGVDGFWNAYSSGRWVSHLWFLLDLIVFTVAAAGVWSLVPRLTQWKPPLLFGGAVMLVLPLASAAIRAACDRGLVPPGKYLGILNLTELFYYMPFFLYGMLERPGEDPERLRKLSVWSMLVLIAITVVPMYRLPGERLYYNAALAWCLSILCIQVGVLCMNRPIGFLRSLADASYTIFLFHQLIVVALGLALMHTSLPLGLKFATVVGVAFSLSLAIHVFVIRRSAWLSLMFNGRVLRPAVKPQGPARELSGSDTVHNLKRPSSEPTVVMRKPGRVPK